MNKVNPYGVGMGGLSNMSNLHAMQNALPSYTPEPVAFGVFVSGRFSETEAIIRNVAWLSDVYLRLEIDRGWLKNTYRVKFSGKNAKEAMDDLSEKFAAAANRDRKR